MISLLLLCTLITLCQGGVIVEQENGAVPLLDLFENYKAVGTVKMPYVEIIEPFEAWFSTSLGKSRIGNLRFVKF